MDAYEKAEAEYQRVKDQFTHLRTVAQTDGDWAQAIYWQLRLNELNQQWDQTYFP